MPGGGPDYWSVANTTARITGGVCTVFDGYRAAQPAQSCLDAVDPLKLTSVSGVG